MNFNNKAYIKLCKKYYLFKLKTAKPFNQRVESFIILYKYDKLIYKLKLLKIPKIYSIIFIIILKSASKKEDLYYRFKIRKIKPRYK